MASPADEFPEPKYPPYNPHAHDRNSDEDGTVFGEGSFLDPNSSRQNLMIDTAKRDGDQESQQNLRSPGNTREQAHRLDDDLRMLQVERQVSAAIDEQDSDDGDPSQNRSMKRERSRRQEIVDKFDVDTNPLHEKAQAYKPPEHPDNNFALLFKKIHNSSFLVRYFTYIVPIVLIILIPLLIGALVAEVKDRDPGVGGVRLVWFCVWLEIVWLTLWAGRVSSPRTCCFPVPLLTCNEDPCQNGSLSVWTDFEPLHKQQQEVARHVQAARGRYDYLFLATRC